MDVSVVERSSCVDSGKGPLPPASAATERADGCRRCHQLATLLRGTHRAMVALAISAGVEADPVLALLIDTNERVLADPLFEGTFQFLRYDSFSIERHSEGVVMHDRRGAVVVQDRRLVAAAFHAITAPPDAPAPAASGEFVSHADVTVPLDPAARELGGEG